MVVEQGGRILAANAAFATLVGLDHDALIGGALADWIESPEGLSQSALSQTLLKSDTGASIPVEVAVRLYAGEREAAPMLIYSIRDLRRRLAQERRIATWPATTV